MPVTECLSPLALPPTSSDAEATASTQASHSVPAWKSQPGFSRKAMDAWAQMCLQWVRTTDPATSDEPLTSQVGRQAYNFYRQYMVSSDTGELVRIQGSSGPRPETPARNGVRLHRPSNAVPLGMLPMGRGASYGETHTDKRNGPHLIALAPGATKPDKKLGSFGRSRSECIHIAVNLALMQPDIPLEEHLTHVLEQRGYDPVEPALRRTVDATV